MNELAKRHPLLTADVVLADARPASSVLHSLFEWDDSAAGEKFRLQQASNLIRAVVIILPQTNTQVRAFLNVVTDKGRGYMDSKAAMRHPVYRDQLLQAAYADLMNWKRRYESLEEFARLVQEIDKIPPPRKRRAG